MKYISRYLDHQRALIEESFGFVFEDKESKNMHKARAWIRNNRPEVLGQTMQVEEHGQIKTIVVDANFIIQEVRNMVNNVRLVDCKFLVGATRIYFDC